MPRLRAAPVDSLWITLAVAGVATLVLDTEGVIVWTNSTVADIFGRPVDAFIGHNILDSIPKSGPAPAAITRLLNNGEPMIRVDVTVHDASGIARDLAASASITSTWDNTPHIVCILEDLTPQRRIQRSRVQSSIEMVRLATHDALTGIANRTQFENDLGSALRRARRDGRTFAVLFCDLDGFKGINDTWGHQVGDRLLQSVARRLNATIRHHDSVARLGGDEFVIIAEEVETPDAAITMGHRLITAVTQPLAIDGNEIRVGMSVGVAMSARRENPAELIALADRAMYQAKRSGSGGVAMLDEQPSAQAWELTNSPASGSARGDAS